MSHYILRRFQIVDLAAITAGTWDPGDYDGFVYGGDPALGSAAMQTVAALVAQGKRAFRYHALSDYGTSAFTTNWYNWWRDTAQAPAGWNASVFDATSKVGLYYAVYPYDPAGEARCWVDWRDITAGTRRQAVIDKMLELSPNGGLFLDNGWLDPATSTWIFKDDGAFVDNLGRAAALRADLVSNNPSWDTDHSAAIRAFITDLATAVAARGAGDYTIVNGETRTRGGQIIPRPMYYENSKDSAIHTWAEAVAGWKLNRNNILSIHIDNPGPTDISDLLSVWGENGGWICFGANIAADDSRTMSAYAQAAGFRRALLGRRASIIPPGRGAFLPRLPVRGRR